MRQRPADSPTPGWDLEVTATRDIQQDEEILLSYGERDNDDFFTHYGFVPLRNPHDDVVLFHNMADLMQWHRTNIGLKVRGSACHECTFMLLDPCNTAVCRGIAGCMCSHGAFIGTSLITYMRALHELWAAWYKAWLSLNQCQKA